MRLLLVSDTHGHLDRIDALATSVGADAVVHAGDFGFYDDASVDRLEARELFLRVVHSDLSPDEKTRVKKLRSDAMRAFIREKLPLSDLGAWLRAGRGFRVPVYAVWGNHEDRAVLDALLTGRARVPNLHLLHEGEAHRVGPFLLCGLGGNLIPGRLSDVPAPLAGDGGKVWTTLAQIGRLAETVAHTAREGDVRVFVSHVSPGKEPVVQHLAASLGAHVTVSGHMGSPWAVVWDDFAVREPDDATDRLAAVRARVRDALDAPLPDDASLRVWVERARLLFEATLEPAANDRGDRPPRWYRGTFHVNLPDAPDGHAVLAWRDGALALETTSLALRPPG